MEGYEANTYGDRFVDVYDDWYGDVTDAGACTECLARLVAEAGGGSASRAMLELSNRYRDGNGAPANRDKAREWLVKYRDSLPAGIPGRMSAEAAMQKFDASLL